MEAPNWLIIIFGLVGINSDVRAIRKRYVNTAVRAFSNSSFWPSDRRGPPRNRMITSRHFQT